MEIDIVVNSKYPIKCIGNHTLIRYSVQSLINSNGLVNDMVLDPDHHNFLCNRCRHKIITSSKHCEQCNFNLCLNCESLLLIAWNKLRNKCGPAPSNA